MNRQHRLNDNDLFATLGERYKEHIHTISVPKNTVLLTQGSIASALYLVREGMLRLYHNTDDGKDITLQFFSPGQSVASIESLYLGTPSNFSLETISACTLAVLSREDILRYLHDDNDVQRLTTEYACLRLIDYITLFLSRIKDSPEKRYETLLATQPELLTQVPHHYIASYLGISATSLSRIRRRLAEKNDKS
ncbi:MAG: Crp/Fnr family transcriptional regulator [Peptococcaceae bacterium]|nr:Crp/Fnr family transcriptional regulator [Peptococcaceae bacterium]